MKKLIFSFLTLYVSAFIFAQDANATKPTKEDFFYTWVTTMNEEKTRLGGKTTVEITFLNESSYTYFNKALYKTPKQNYTISSWKEAVNTYQDVEEYPYGFRISFKPSKKSQPPDIAVFMNADKTKFLYVLDIGFYTDLEIYIKK